MGGRGAGALAPDGLFAARAFEEAGAMRQAAEAYEELLDEACRAACAQGARPGLDVADLARAVARCHLALHAWAPAGRAFARAGLDEEAAAAFERADDLVAAAGAWVRLGDLPAAAAGLERGGQRGKAETLRAVRCILDGRDLEAAAHLENAGDKAGAATRWAAAGEFARAGRLYEEMGDRAAAASAFERAGERRTRTEDEPTGEQGRATTPSAVPASGRLLRAGEDLLRLGDLEGAEAALKRIPDASADYRVSSRLLGDIYLRQGRAAAATAMYRRAIEGLRPRADTADVFYRAGKGSLDDGDLAAAVALLDALWQFDPTWRDVERQRQAAQLRLVQETSRCAGARYERLGPIGEGGMGRVYRARDLVLGREVALKVMTTPEDEATWGPDTFLREAKAAASLNHRNIVTVYDFGESDGGLFLAMELIEGTTLRDLVRDRGVLDLETIERVLLQACDALSYAHGRGVVHRDVKPANLMWTPAGRLKITDFGLAKALPARTRPVWELKVPEEGGPPVIHQDEERTWEGTQSRLMGTPFYMSPEQILMGRIDGRTDVYSLGVTLFELATGRLPFTSGDIFQAHLVQEPPSPASLRPDLAGWLEETILRCLAKEPGSRFPSVEALREAVPGA